MNLRPLDPEREGYTFTGWDTDFTNVTEDLTVTATYTQIIRYGHVLDGETITVADAITVLRHIVGLAFLNEEEQKRAKVSSGEGDITVGDAILILRYIVGLIDKFPVEEQQR